MPRRTYVRRINQIKNCNLNSTVKKCKIYCTYKKAKIKAYLKNDEET